MNLLRIVSKLLPTQIAYAHCDVPCGIYSVEPAKIAAATVLKMVQKINELVIPNNDEKDKWLEYKNALTRMILTKEEHARICKHELLILWTDYFKAEHLKLFPNLHETFWNAAKLCSKNKQNIDETSALELIAQVEKIAVMFEKSKK